MYYRRNQCLPVYIMIILISGILLGCSDPTGPETEPIIPLNNQFVFSRDTTGSVWDDDIYLMNADGSEQIKLAEVITDEIDPLFSPDGQKIIFLNRDDSGDIAYYAVNIDGSGQTQLTNKITPAWNPIFSPDGSKIVFSSYDGNDWEIYSINADGSGQTNLTDNATNDGAPSFSPDGTKIVYQVGHNNRYEDEEIYLMNADGSEQTNLTDNERFTEYKPVFSPDGNKIAYIDGDDIAIMNDDGSGRIYLISDQNRNSDPVFSPDGAKIAFSSYYDDNKQDIFAVKTDGSGSLSNLTKSPSSFDGEHDWGPNK